MKSFTVLKFKVTEADADLDEIGEICRKSYCAGTEDWLLRQRGKRESYKQRERLLKSSNGNGKPPKEKAETTKLYHAIREAVPAIGSVQASMLSREVWQQLRAKIDWRQQTGSEDEEPRRRQDAIVAYEARPPFRSSLSIPLHNKYTTIKFTDRLTITVQRPIMSVPWLTVELSLRKMPPGKQRLLREIIAGTRKQRDSELVYKDTGKDPGWYWFQPLMFETEIRSDLTAELFPVLGKSEDAKTDRPFLLKLPEVKKPKYAGDGRYLVASLDRVSAKRKMVGIVYKQRRRMTGHGRRKVDRAVKRRRHQERCIRDEVRRRAIAYIVRQCVSHNIGTLLWRKPSLPVRQLCWFEVAGVSWDWTRWYTDLKNAAARQGILVKSKVYKMAEAKPPKPKEEGEDCEKVAEVVSVGD